MRKVKTYAVSSRAVHIMSYECLASLIEQCKEIKEEWSEAEEILRIYDRNPRALLAIVEFAIAYAAINKDLIPTMDIVAEVDEDGKVVNVKPDVQDYLV